jgi:hypothetical protein
VLVDYSDRELGLIVFLRIWRDQFLDISLAFVLSTAVLGIGAMWMLWSENVGPEVVDLSLFPDFVEWIRWILVQGSTGTFPGHIDMCLAG